MQELALQRNTLSSVSNTQNSTQEAVTTYALTGILPEKQRVALQPATGVLALLERGGDFPRMIDTRQFTLSELCVLIPLLEAYPDYCPHEVLLACFYNGRANVTEGEITRCRTRLHTAHMEGVFDQEIRPVRNVLSRTRLKLHPFGIDIVSLLETGYLLRPKIAFRKTP